MTDGSHIIDNIVATIWEGNTEIGSFGAEPHWQLSRYYTEATFHVAKDPNKRLPMLLGARYGEDCPAAMRPPAD